MAALLQIASFATAVLLLCGGAAACLGADNVAKRAIGVFIALVGALLSAASLHVASGTLVAAIVIAGGYAALGLTLLVRLQETYQSVEANELDASDLTDEPPEPRA